MSCNCEGIIIEVPREGIDGNGIANIELLGESGLEKTYRINFTNGEYFDYVVTDGSSIASIAKTGTQILVDTYTVTLTDGNTTTFQVTNGRSVVSITKTNTDVLTDTYTISYNDNTTSTFQVVNGNGIVSIEKTNTDVLVDTYTITLSNNTTVTYQVVNGRGIRSITKVGSADLVDTYRILYNDNTYTDYTVTNGEKGDTGTGIVSITKTGSSGLVDTYTVLLSDTSSYTFTVTNGEKGDSATIAIGTVTTGAEGSSASVTNRGDEHDAIWDITIPRGNTGNGISSITLLSQSGLVKTYRITYTNGTHFDFSVSDGNGIASIEKTGTSGAVDTYTVTFTDPQAEPFEYTVTNGSDEWGAIVGDLSDQTDLQQALDNKAPVITESASGDIVTIADGADLPVESLSVNVEPVQDLHGYDAPWPAGGGTNLWGGIKLATDINTAITSTLDTTAKTISFSAYNGINLVVLSGNTTFKANTQYTLILDGTGSSSENIFNLQFKYTDGTTSKDEGKYIKAGVNVSTSGKTVEAIVGRQYASTTVLNYEKCGLFEGDKTASDFTPWENICPISGWAQANVTRTNLNIWGGEKMANDMVEAVNNSAYCAKGTDTVGNYVTLVASNAVNAKVFSTCKFKPNTQYSFFLKASKSNTSAASNLLVRYTDGTFISANFNNSSSAITIDTIYTWVFVSAAGKTIANIEGVYYSGTTKIYYDSCGIFEGVHTADEFTPYQGQQVTIPLGQTVYGGTVDVTAGQMRVTHAMVDLGDLTWTKQPDTEQYQDFRTTGIASLVAKPQASQTPNAICSAFIVLDRNHSLSQLPNLGITTAGNLSVSTQPSSYASASDFKAAMSGVQLVYELATPLTIALDPATLSTLLGDNIIWADTGDTTVEYRADTKLYIQELTKPTEDDMIANANISSGKYFMVGNALYYSTASIAAGETIVPGTNCTALSLADALNNLNA